MGSNSCPVIDGSFCDFPLLEVAPVWISKYLSTVHLEIVFKRVCMLRYWGGGDILPDYYNSDLPGPVHVWHSPLGYPQVPLRVS
jgi:hypothetical protein